MSPPSDSVSVLHVDDDPNIVALAAEFLERASDRITVETATSIGGAWDALESGSVDCVVSDYDMPEQNGIEFLEDVRDQHPELPFILYTGMGSEQVASEAISAGVTDYLQKESGSSQYEVLANRITNAVDQHRSSQAVEATEQKLSLLAEKTEDVLFMMDGDWSEVEFVNSAFEDIWGMPVEELENDPEAFIEGVHPADRERARRSMERLVDGRPDEIAYRVVQPDGETRWIRAQSKPVFDEDGDVESIVGFVTDVSERAEMERQLREERQFVEQALDALDDVFYVVGPDGELERWNSRVPEVSGYSEDAIEGMHVTEFFPESERPRIYEALEEVLETGRAIVESELETADGTRIPYELTGARLTDHEGNTMGLVGIGRDISERKARERELEEQNRRLEEFASIVSHDLRNPLQVAEGHLELARDECATSHLDDVERAHGRMGTLIEDLLTLTHDEDAASDLEPVAIGDLVDQFRRTTDTSQATILTESTRAIRADRSLVQQLLTNLLQNAIEHGGEDVTVRIGDLPDGFYVADDGPGIPESERDRVFDPGYSTASGRTGYGLHIVSEIVAAHGWEIAVLDGEAGGVRFEITGVDRPAE